MKNIIFFFVLITVFSACQVGSDIYQNENEDFSENKKGLTNWIIQNIPNVKTMDRSQWLLISEEMKDPVYSVFTYDQKYRFWLDKIEKTLKLDWNKAELQHLNDLYDFVKLNESIFKENALENDDLHEFVTSFEYKWRGFAEEKLGWSVLLQKSLLAEGSNLKDKSGVLENSGSFVFVEVLTRSESVKCNCSQSSDFCRGLCQWGCTLGGDNCGFLWLNTCDGYCTK